MTTTPDQIDLWRKSPSEHQRLEFKEAKNQFDSRKLHEYCVALANEGGGRLLLGIADKPPRQIVGTQAFPDPVSVRSRGRNRPLAVRAFDRPGRRVICRTPPWWLAAGEKAR